MTAVVRPLYIEQGATYRLGFTWYRAGPVVNGVVTPGDPWWDTVPDGIDVRMQIRKKQGATVLVDATLANGHFTLGPDGRVDLTLSDEDTDLLIIKSALYDLEIALPPASGETEPDVHRLLQGPVTVSPNITQDPDDPVMQS